MIPSEFYAQVGETIDAVSSGMLENLFQSEEAIRSFTRDEITGVIEEAFAEGYKWTADAIHARTAGGTSVTYPRALEMLSDLESTDDWSYSVPHLEDAEGVELLARLYGVPTLKVASDLAELRREQIKQYLSERGHG